MAGRGFRPRGPLSHRKTIRMIVAAIKVVTGSSLHAE